MVADRVKVTTTGEGQPSGLAMMMLQYIEQNINEFDDKNEQASNIKGAVAIEAAEGGVGVTLLFKGDEIEIAEGCLPNADMVVRGGIFDITELAAGAASGNLRKICSGRLKIESAWRHPMFALRVARFMSLPPEMRAAEGAANRTIGWKLAAGAAAAAILTLAAFFVLR